jgi:putative endonuclease
VFLNSGSFAYSAEAEYSRASAAFFCGELKNQKFRATLAELEDLHLKVVIAWVYIITNSNHTVLYIGSIDLRTRMWEHTTKQNPKSFSAKYNLNKLVYFEEFEDVEQARQRELFIKKKTIKWKIDLVNSTNPFWKELNPEESRCAQLY